MHHNYANDEEPDVEGYCDYCHKDGHTFRFCPRRDDDPMYDWDDDE